MPRFVLLYHECPPDFERPSHWDLMLEVGDKLRTWAISRLPHGWEGAKARTAVLFPSCAATSLENCVVATPLADHRIDYLQIEGALSGKRGEVRRIEAGTYEAVSQNSRTWTVVLSGGVVSGTVTLQDATLSL
jgi:hypothetical protein